MSDEEQNAGVGAQTGFALQRNTALYVLLNNYHSKFTSPNYFICLEHHDDFVFCFLDVNGEANFVEAYQSKKKSPHQWTVSKELTEILVKLLKTGIRIKKDPLTKSAQYRQSLHFTTNTSILIDIKGTKNVSIDEERTLLKFSDLDSRIKTALIHKFEACGLFETTLRSEYENLHFLYIEFTRTAREQRNLLSGKIGEIFGKSISDKEAAVDTIFSLFQKVELIYNQGGSSFLDKSKRVSGQEISDAFKIITTQSKAFDYWRSECKEISSKLEIKPYERERFESVFVASFDLFKSMKEAEHQKILSFVNQNYKGCRLTSEEECVDELFQIYKKSKSTKFMDFELKAILYAAYFQVINKKEE